MKKEHCGVTVCDTTRPAQGGKKFAVLCGRRFPIVGLVVCAGGLSYPLVDIPMMGDKLEAAE